MIASLLAIFFYPFTTLKISDSIYIFKAYEIKRKKIILSFLQEMSKNFFVRLLFSIFVFFLCHQTSPILGSILQIILIFLIILYYFGKYVIFYCKTKSSFYLLQSILFSISSTIQASVAQKPKPILFSWSAVNKECR